MKHQWQVSAFLIVLFLAAQVVGLFVIRANVDIEASEAASAEAGKPVNVFRELPFGIERPDVAPDTSFIFLTIAVIIGTALMLLIIRFKKQALWKVWFLFALLITLTVSFSSFIPKAVAALFAAIIAYFRVFRPNILAHNIGELFIYGGLAAIFVPVMNVKSAAILLVIIALYDLYAVFHSKHMITLAKFQAANSMFAGLLIPKKMSLKAATASISRDSAPARKSEKYADTGNYAVIGGGDIGFPLLFAGTTLAAFGLPKVLIISVAATAALAILLLIGKKGKFYPAMPFIAAGCFIGYGTASLF